MKAASNSIGGYTIPEKVCLLVCIIRLICVHPQQSVSIERQERRAGDINTKGWVTQNLSSVF